MVSRWMAWGLVALIAAVPVLAESKTKNEERAVPDPWLLCVRRDHVLNDCLLVDAQGNLLSREVIEQPWSPYVADSIEYPDDFDRLGHFRDGMMPFIVRGEKYSDTRYGYIDARGRVAVPAKYHNAGPFSEGRARVCDERGCGYIDVAGREVIALRREWTDVRDFHDGRALVRGPGWTIFMGESIGPRHFAEPWAVIDHSGKHVLGPGRKEQIDFQSFNQGRSSSQRQVRRSPHPIFDPKFWPIRVTGDFSEGVAPFSQNARTADGNDVVYGLMDINGKVVVPVKYLSPMQPLRNHFTVTARRTGELYEEGLLHRKGRFIPCKDIPKQLGIGTLDCDEAMERLSAHKEEALPTGFTEWVTPFRDGRAVVRTQYTHEAVGDAWQKGEMLIDRQGRILASYAELIESLQPATAP